jgi:hypothetical protein
MMQNPYVNVSAMSYILESKKSYTEVKPDLAASAPDMYVIGPGFIEYEIDPTQA